MEPNNQKEQLANINYERKIHDILGEAARKKSGRSPYLGKILKAIHKYSNQDIKDVAKAIEKTPEFVEKIYRCEVEVSDAVKEAFADYYSNPPVSLSKKSRGKLLNKNFKTEIRPPAPENTGTFGRALYDVMGDINEKGEALTSTTISKETKAFTQATVWSYFNKKGKNVMLETAYRIYDAIRVLGHEEGAVEVFKASGYEAGGLGKTPAEIIKEAHKNGVALDITLRRLMTSKSGVIVRKNLMRETGLGSKAISNALSNTVITEGKKAHRMVQGIFNLLDIEYSSELKFLVEEIRDPSKDRVVRDATPVSPGHAEKIAREIGKQSSSSLGLG